jgi:hypothetical protein
MISQIQCTAIGINPLDIIPKAYLDMIKLKDKNPLFATYVVGVEGISKPKILETGMARVITWSREAINQITDKIRLGLNVIKGHTKDNILRNEEILGVVAGKNTKQINGKLSSVIAVYFPNKNNSNFDTISMESDVLLSDEGHIQNVDEVKRFALGKSDEVVPAFEGAVKVGEIQCFDPITINETKIKQEGNSKMTFQEVKEAIRQLNIFPSQLYSIEDLIGNVENKEGNLVFYGGVDDKLTAALNKRLPDIKPLKEEISLKDAKLKELEEHVNSFQAEKKNLVKEQANIKLRNYITNDKVMDAKQKAYLEKRIARFTVNEGSEDEIKNFVNEQLNDYKEFIAIHQDKFIGDNAQLLPDTMPEPTFNTNGIPKGYL